MDQTFVLSSSRAHRKPLKQLRYGNDVDAIVEKFSQMIQSDTNVTFDNVAVQIQIKSHHCSHYTCTRCYSEEVVVETERCQVARFIRSFYIRNTLITEPCT